MHDPQDTAVLNHRMKTALIVWVAGMSGALLGFHRLGMIVALGGGLWLGYYALRRIG